MAQTTSPKAAAVKDALPTTMRALVKEKPGPGLVLKQVPVPRIGPTDVLVRGNVLYVAQADADTVGA